jgi:hypothetical protein
MLWENEYSPLSQTGPASLRREFSTGSSGAVHSLHDEAGQFAGRWMMSIEIKRRNGWRRAAPFLALAGALALGGCYEDGYGYGGGAYAGGGYYGDGYADGYYGDGYGYYGDGYYGGYPPFGWYNGFYYPGSGLFIYDRSGHRHDWHGGGAGGWHGGQGGGWHGGQGGGWHGGQGGGWHGGAGGHGNWHGGQGGVQGSHAPATGGGFHGGGGGFHGGGSHGGHH